MRIVSPILLAAALLTPNAARSSPLMDEDQRPLHLRIERDGDHRIVRLVARASPPMRVHFVLEIDAPSRTRHAGSVEARPREQVISTVRFRAGEGWTARLTVESATAGTYIEQLHSSDAG